MTTLLEALHALDGNDIDVWDTELDLGVAWCETDPESDDPYDVACRLMASNIDFVDERDDSKIPGYPIKWFIADISGFVREHIDVFRQLAAASGWTMYGNLDDDVEIGVNMMSCLVSGSADDGAYEIIINGLRGA